MIVTRTPLRVSFAGGGTDLKEFYSSGYGAVVSMAINKHIYIAAHRGFDRRFILKYSEVEAVEDVDDIKHSLIRECLRDRGYTSGVEIASFADIPSQGTGLGSSSSFAVGLLHALELMTGEEVTREFVAKAASRVEIEQLNEPIGKQDQYAAAFGGLNYIRFNADHSVVVEPIGLAPDAAEQLGKNLLLVYTGITRKASDVLAKQKNNTLNDRSVFERLVEMRDMADELKAELELGKLDVVGEFLARGWALKKKLASGMSRGPIDDIYNRGIAAGALGGKLLGAGGGGFVLFYCPSDKMPGLKSEFSSPKDRCFVAGIDAGGTSVVTKA